MRLGATDTADCSSNFSLPCPQCDHGNTDAEKNKCLNMHSTDSAPTPDLTNENARLVKCDGVMFQPSLGTLASSLGDAGEPLSYPP